MAQANFIQVGDRARDQRDGDDREERPGKPANTSEGTVKVAFSGSMRPSRRELEQVAQEPSERFAEYALADNGQDPDGPHRRNRHHQHVEHALGAHHSAVEERETGVMSRTSAALTRTQAVSPVSISRISMATIPPKSHVS